MKNLFRLIAIAFVSVFIISACGQKGPLFLPGNPSEMQPQPPEEEQGQDEDEEDPDDDDQPGPPR